MTRRARTPIYLEVGKSKVFACSVEWPGWCRSGKGEEAAMERLLAYAERYGAAVPGFADPGELDVVQRVPGNGTTDFGAPDVVPQLDQAPYTEAEAARARFVLEASWRALERAAAAAPAVLPKGPRGGGRDRDALVAHVLEAERSYGRMIGVRHPPRVEPEVVRAGILEVLGRRHNGPPREGGWPARYAARRIAWHVLDHAWELEDKSSPS